MVKTTKADKAAEKAATEPATEHGTLPSLGSQPIQTPAPAQQPAPDRTGSTIPLRTDAEPKA